MALEEINGDLLEADVGGVSAEPVLGLPFP
jgi:hypothetical protein